MFESIIHLKNANLTLKISIDPHFQCLQVSLSLLLSVTNNIQKTNGNQIVKQIQYNNYKT